MNNGAPRTVLVLDDDASTLRSIGRLFTARGYNVRTFSAPDDFLRVGPPAEPACLLLDYHFGPHGGARGLEVHGEIKRRGWSLPTIFLTAEWDAHVIVKAMRGGAVDYLTKPFDPEELLGVVDRAFQDSAQMHSEQQEKLRLQLRAAALSAREREIIRMVVAGKLNKEIAHTLKLALITVKVHRARAMKKLGARNPAELATLARRANLVDQF